MTLLTASVRSLPLSFVIRSIFFASNGCGSAFFIGEPHHHPGTYPAGAHFQDQARKMTRSSSLSRNFRCLDSENQEDKEKEVPSIRLRNKIRNGALAAPAILTAPLYGFGFGLLGHKPMWAFSKRVYKLTKPSEGHVHHHFGRMQNFLEKDDNSIAVQKSRSYRIHPTFAGLSLITTALLAFRQDMFLPGALGGPSAISTLVASESSRSILCLSSYERFRALNIFICFVSALAARPLVSTMLGNKSTRRWNRIQGDLSMLFAALTACPGYFGRLMIHLNWSILFCGGVLERLYVLCILSQLSGVSDREKYIALYSPQIKIATIASIPLGILTFLVMK